MRTIIRYAVAFLFIFLAPLFGTTPYVGLSAGLVVALWYGGRLAGPSSSVRPRAVSRQPPCPPVMPQPSRTEIHVGRDGNALGAFGRQQIVEGLARGHFLGTDLAWREGMSDWVPLSLFPGIGSSRH